MNRAISARPSDNGEASELSPEVRSLPLAGRGRKAIVGLGWSALNNGSATVIAAIVFVVTSRLLGPYEFGVVALAASIVTFVSCAAPGAFGEAIVQRSRIASEHLDTVFWMCAASGVVLYLPILFLASFVADFSGEPVLAALLPFIGLKLLADLVAVVPQALVIRAMEFKYIAARTAIGNGVGGLVCVVMALNGYGLWALATAPVITSLVSLAILLRAARWRPGFRLDRAAARDLMRFGLFSSGNRTLNVINLDQMLLGFMAGPAVLGLYFFGKRLYDLLSGVTSKALYPVATVLFAGVQLEPNKHIKVYGLAMRAATLAAFPIFSGLYILSESAIPLVLGSHWHPAVTAIEAFALIGLLAGLRVPSASLANGLGRADIWFAFELTRYVLSLAVIVLFIDSGLGTVMTGLVLVNAAIAPGCYLIARKLIGISVRQYMKPLMAPLVASAIMCAVILVLPSLVSSMTPGLLLLCQILAGTITYGLVVLSMSAQEVGEIRRVFAQGKANG